MLTLILQLIVGCAIISIGILMHHEIFKFPKEFTKKVFIAGNFVYIVAILVNYIKTVLE